jgi:hypothetical protein
MAPTAGFGKLLWRCAACGTPLHYLAFFVAHLRTARLFLKPLACDGTSCSICGHRVK